MLPSPMKEGGKVKKNKKLILPGGQKHGVRRFVVTVLLDYLNTW